jgi:hypothetical protein
MHAHIYIQCTREAKMKFSCIPPRSEPGKAWHGLNMMNQGVVGEHDEQYQLLAGT